MRAYPYALSLSLLLLLPACPATPLCGDSSKCDGTGSTDGTDGTSTGTTDSTGSTGSTTDDPTGSTTGPSTTGSSTDATTSTGSTTASTGATTDEPMTTGTTTGDPPLVGDPSTYGQACAPDDGPATEFKIQLAERLCDSDWPEDAPIFRVTIFQGVQLPVGVYSLEAGSAFVYYDIGDGNPLGAKGGTLEVTEVTGDGLRGTYDITLVDDTHLSGDFDALYCPVDVLCG